MTVDADPDGSTADRPFVTVDWLAANRDRSDVHVLDVREAWEYEGIGHVPGAVNVPFDRFRDDGDEDEGRFPGAERFAELLGDAGVRPDDALVAYDDEHGVFAARVVLTAWRYGHADARLLDGDYSAWLRTQPTSTAPAAPTPVDYPTPETDDRWFTDAAGVRRTADTPRTVLVDTRTPAEYDEGHLPGAVQLDWRDLLDPEDRGLLPEAALLEVLADHGITTDRRVVLYCNTARRLSHTYLALRQVGVEDVVVYEGSLTDWRERGLELETD